MRRIFLAILIIVGVFNLSAETVTYIVNSRTSVRQEGDLIEGAIVSFSQTSSTGKVGQMTAGNCTSFKLMNLTEVAITDITLTMHSNASAGAGTLQVRRNNEIVAEIEDSKFSSPMWYGEYTNADVKVKVSLSKQILFQRTDSLVIDICASTNSLYISSYSITYNHPNTVGYVVRLHTGVGSEVITLRENVPNEGVVLPDMNISADYRFIGWTDQPIKHQSYSPDTYQPLTTIYPIRNMTLYAVYKDVSSSNQLWTQETEFKSGYYLLADTYDHCFAYGTLDKSNHINARQVSNWIWNSDSLRCYVGTELYEEEIYFVDFLSDTELTIYNVSGESYINPPRSINSPALSQNSTPVAWTYELKPYNQICIYHSFSHETTKYLKLDAEGINNNFYFYASERGSTTYWLMLFNVDDIPDYSEPYYTSFPMMNFTDDVDNVSVSEVQVTPEGVINKTNLEIKLFTLAGVEVRRSRGDLSFEGLSSGVYILTTISGSQKVIVR